MRITVVAILLLLSSTTTASEFDVGRSYLIGGHWFQFVGVEHGHDHWLYPHVDGVHEIFEAVDDRTWTGLLGSRFRPTRGTFENRFNAAAVLNELLHEDASRVRRSRAVRLLSLFVELHPAEEAPYYLRESQPRWDRYLDEEANAWVADRLRRYSAWTEGLDTVGTRVLSAPQSLDDSDDFYASMIEDGYFDIAVIGGNSKDEESGKTYSWTSSEALREMLEARGFSSDGFRSSDDPAVTEKTVRLLGRDIRVRIHVTGGSFRKPRIRRAVANFVESLAYADVVIYQGHSNKLSGKYYLSESKSSFSRFRIGLGSQSDLARKCHELGTKRYQIFALQSCYSFDKYCQPLRTFYRERFRDRNERVGYLGTAEICYFLEFVPRYLALIDGLISGQGARDLAQRMNQVRPVDDAAPLIFRGLLQAPATFILPADTSLDTWTNHGRSRGYLVLGEASDGKTYASTELFPQNDLGEVRQVIVRKRGAYAIDDQGRVLYSGSETGGVTVELPETKASGLRFTFGAYAHRHDKWRLYLISESGELFYRHRKGGALTRVAGQPGEFVAVGNEADGTLAATRRDGSTWVQIRGRWEAREKAPTWVNVTPHLDGHGVAGQLWRADEPRAPRG